MTVISKFVLTMLLQTNTANKNKSVHKLRNCHMQEYRQLQLTTNIDVEQKELHGRADVA